MNVWLACDCMFFVCCDYFKRLTLRWCYSRITNDTHLTVVSFFLAGHQHKQEGDLFRQITTFDKHIDGKQLRERRTAEFKGVVHVPSLGSA